MRKGIKGGVREVAYKGRGRGRVLNNFIS